MPDAPFVSIAVMALVRERMEARGVSAYRLAKLADVPQSSLSRWLNGQSAITVDDLHALGQALDVDAGVWLTRLQVPGLGPKSADSGS